MTLRFGGWEIDLLDCGTIELPAAALGPEAAGPARTAVTATLLRGHGRTVLVDAGTGPCAALWPGAGGDGLLGALERAGAAPSAITEILLTHLDFDHSGGRRRRHVARPDRAGLRRGCRCSSPTSASRPGGRPGSGR